ncbi:sigma-70 family RNA polymerase sigma factor [Pseudoalteromonas sp. MMG013]|uniref:sigma-70 family RNA polymerase sigma factor n=1 Tax=Pseudoalteromonas sp. MMG013 TaxID=2822687 RepID=UPI001B3845C0|nr:sigma-70 family RNA polymerase sigma factor [Pseudoalteromonas sp. MMG013]MBQ4861517.1 sigma-70 family RNA polymerase sigma factor [Pseudoalteromonas sp. MMG013]
MTQIAQQHANMDETLMLEYGKGNDTAFAELYARHKGPMYRYICRQLGSKQHNKAQELFQEVWVRVIDNRNNYTVEAKFTTWLYRIAHNLLIDEHRKNHVRGEHLTLVSDEQHEGILAFHQGKQEGSVHNDFLQQAIKHCVELLMPQQREAFLLRHEAGFDPSQVCEIVGAKPETVKTRLRYAMSQLRDCLQRKVGATEVGGEREI